MRLLCLNPNRTAAVTHIVAAEVQRVLGDAATVIPATAGFGPDVIRTKLDHAVAQHAAVDLAAQHATGADAVLLAVSYDTALDALRESLGMPVVGMSEAAIMVARLQGRRLGYVSLGAATTSLYRDALARYDIDRDLVAWEVREPPTGTFASGNSSALDAVLAEAAREVEQAGVDVVVFLGAVTAGAAYRLSEQVAVPLVDGGSAGAVIAAGLHRLGGPSLRRCAGSTMAGVSQALVDLAAGKA